MSLMALSEGLSMDELYFHDGILKEIKILGSGKVKILCDLYLSVSEKSRTRYRFECHEVKSFSSMVDVEALLENQKFGNINDGRLVLEQDGKTRFKLFLVDGYLEISAARVEVLLE